MFRMQQLILTVAVFVFTIWSSVEAQLQEPLCQNKNCPDLQVCRVLETCSSQNVCSLDAICLPRDQSNYLSGGCRIGNPLLKPGTRGGYEMTQCYTDKNCRDGFYCSTALQDVGARCCRSDSTSPAKAGSCPAPEILERFWCVDECLSDGDCNYDMKCCPNSQSCQRGKCKSPAQTQPPDPCSTVRCPSGSQCAPAPDGTTACVPVPPPQEPEPIVSNVEPLCRTKVCQALEVCRVVQTCASPDSCSVEAICLSRTQSNFLTGGCNIGEPLLEPKAGGGYDLNTCYTAKNCRDGFYCSAVLMDVASRCCRADTGSASAPKAGSCPVPDNYDTFFCVDECRSDADCNWDMKCCQNSGSCRRSKCKSPDPCSLKTCSSGQKCVLSPDRSAVCVQDPAQRPSSPINNNNNNNPPAPSYTCPYPYGPYQRGECDFRNQCGYSSNVVGCPPGKLCCATYHCGNICRWPVPY